MEQLKLILDDLKSKREEIEKRDVAAAVEEELRRIEAELLARESMKQKDELKTMDIKIEAISDALRIIEQSVEADAEKETESEPSEDAADEQTPASEEYVIHPV